MKKNFYIKTYDFNRKSGEGKYKIDFYTGYDDEVVAEFCSGKTHLWIIDFKQKFPKTYKQLQKYYWCIQTMLEYYEKPYSEKEVRALDYYLKRTLARCTYIDIAGEKIPVVPLKRDMSIDELSELIERVIETYGRRIKKLLGD